MYRWFLFPDSDLLNSCKSNNKESVTKIIQNSTPHNLEKKINSKDRKGNTPLIIACKKNNIEIVQILCNNNADVNFNNINGDSPLIIACEKKI